MTSRQAPIGDTASVTMLMALQQIGWRAKTNRPTSGRRLRLTATGAELIVATFRLRISQSGQIGFAPVPTTTRLVVSLLPPSSFHLTRGDCDGPLSYERSGEECDPIRGSDSRYAAVLGALMRRSWRGSRI
jgi:hypothetical protein